MDFLVYYRCGTDANVRESDNVGWLGKVMCHDDVTGSNRAEAREVPALDLFQREVPKLCNPSNLNSDGAKSISWITRHRSFRNPEWKKFYLADEKSHKNDALYVVFQVLLLNSGSLFWPWYSYLTSYGISSVGQLNLTS
jgi:hypothetical protein